MIRVAIRHDGGDRTEVRTRRQRFGLDAPLPADPRIVERAILRHLAENHPDLLVLALGRPAPPAADADGPARVRPDDGVPDLLLIRPGGGLVFLAIRTQAHRPSRAERAFADLCRDRSVPLHVVRSLPEARRALDRCGIPSPPETLHGSQEGDLARRRT